VTGATGKVGANALFWGEALRTEGVLRAPFGDRPHAMVDEADVAAVAVAALLEDGHSGRTSHLTGPCARSARRSAASCASSS
jgi:uncharacterized protein YbjT (DUF2867 family)